MKKPLIIGLLLLLYVNIQAQEASHYLYLNTGGGFHNLSYHLQNGNEKGSFGYSFNAGYGYFFNEHWGVQAGLGLQTFKPTATLTYQTGTPSTDTDGTTYEYRTYYNNWQEQQRLLFLDIPLAAQYRQKLNEKFQLLAAAGLKISIPVKTTYKTTGGEINTTGFYSQWNVELKDMPQHDFNNITDQQTGNVSIKTSYSGFADLGALYGLSPRLDLYAGGYVNYGLNNVLKSDNKLVYQQGNVYNGVLASNQTDNARTVSLGIKVGVMWHFGNKKKVPDVKIADEISVIKASEPAEATKAAIAELPVASVTPLPETTQKDSAYICARSIAASTIISFKSNTNQLLNAEDSRIRELSEILKIYPGMSLRIVGYVGNHGLRKANYKTGLRNSGIVRQKFLNQGVESCQLIRGVKVSDELQSGNTFGENNIQNSSVTLIVE